LRHWRNRQRSYFKRTKCARGHSLHPTRAFPDIFLERFAEAPGSENETPGTHRTWRLNTTSSTSRSINDE
jgi:hypothetical protein